MASPVSRVVRCGSIRRWDRARPYGSIYPGIIGEVAAGDEQEQSELPPPRQYGETVLIVDDEPSIRMLVADLLEELGYVAIEAADSISGLKVLNSDVRIDLLITDVGLPGGMNGRQMADAARAKRPDLKVLFIRGTRRTPPSAMAISCQVCM